MHHCFRLLPRVMLATLAALTPAALTGQRTSVEARNGMVVSVHELASRSGLEILQRGGNAVDAAVATAFTLGVVYPWAGPLGGGGFMLIHLADGRTIAIDYRETAPAAATRDLFLAADGGVLPAGPGSSTLGWRASGVPGNVAGFAHAHAHYGSGRISWAEVIEPARRLAADGHAVTAFSSSRLRTQRSKLDAFAESRRIFLSPAALGETPGPWPQPELAATLARLQREGPRDFYEGETAHRIAAAMAANDGLITLEDLRNYRVAERVPLRGRYRGYEILTMPPPSSGGIALLQMLGMLEAYDVAALGHHSAAKYHLFVEVMKRAYRDRAEYLGDPDFVRVPVQALLAPDYLRQRMNDFSPDRATPAAEVAPGLGPRAGAATRTESTETTHFSVIDAEGNAVANTFTINGGFGSGVTIPGTGVLMNNQMDDFTSKPGVPNLYGLLQGEANAIAPGKRPLSSMTPAIVLRDGRPFLITGAPGGATIINAVLQVITNVIDHRMPVAQAVAEPRIHHQWMPDVINHDPYGLSTDTAELLRARGHRLALRNLYETEGPVLPLELYPNDTMTILVDPASGVRHGAADSRKPDAAAVGY